MRLCTDHEISGVSVSVAAEKIGKLEKAVVPHGATLKEVEQVMLFIPGASTDAKTYQELTSFNMRRKNLSHMAFGKRPYQCLGAHLTRMELRIMYDTILRKFL